MVNSPRFLRHPNGRGRLFQDAEANRATYIDKTSSASGSAKLRDCELHDHSKVANWCQIYGGRFHLSTVGGKTVIAGNPDVYSSFIDCSEVSGRPLLESAILLGTTEVCDTPQIKGGVTCRDAIIYGSPVLWGLFEVTGRVHEGYWTRAPKHIKLPWCDLSECVDGKLLLDCWCRPIEWWLKFGPQKAREKWDWSQDMIDVTIETIRREFQQITTNDRLVFSGDSVSTVTLESQASD